MNDVDEGLTKAMETYGMICAGMMVDPKVINALAAVENAKNNLVILEEAFAEASKPHQEAMAESDEYIKIRIVELGRSISYKGVEAKHKSGYDRISWNNKKLTEICMSNPALLDLLGSARKVTPVAASVKISYKPPVDEFIEAEFKEIGS